MKAVAATVRKSGYVTLTTETVQGSGQDEAKNYLDRVRAYIPVEIVGFFIFVNSLVLGRKLEGGKDNDVLTIDGGVAVAALVIGAIASIIFARVAAKRAGQAAWVIQAAVTLVAFLVWAYALGAQAFDAIDILIVPSLAGLLLATFTLFSGLIVPVKPEK